MRKRWSCMRMESAFMRKWWSCMPYYKHVLKKPLPSRSGFRSAVFNKRPVNVVIDEPHKDGAADNVAGGDGD